LHEIVYQGASLAAATARGYVSNWDAVNGLLRIRNVKGEFTTGGAIHGYDSSALWTVHSGNSMEDASDPMDDNVRIEQEAQSWLDFTEVNPFGDP
jgi:hypothetical protein